MQADAMADYAGIDAIREAKRTLSSPSLLVAHVRNKKACTVSAESCASEGGEEHANPSAASCWITHVRIRIQYMRSELQQILSHWNCQPSGQR